MEFDVAAPWWWTYATVALVLVAVPYLVLSYARRYSDIRRPLIQIASVAIGLAFLFHFRASERPYVHVRGDVLEVRQRYGGPEQTYAVRDVSSYGFTRVGDAARRSEYYTAMVLLFRDGSTVEVSEYYTNYGRLKTYLDGQGVKSR